MSLAFITIAIGGGIGSLAPRLRDGIYYLENLHDRELSHYRLVADGIETVTLFLPAFFIVVTILVVYVSITRLIEHERGMMGTLASLGFNKAGILFKYVLMVTIATLLGTILGIILGHFFVSPLLFRVIAEQFNIPDTVLPVFPWFGIIASIITVVFSVLMTIILGMLALKGAPCQLLRPKAPKVGAKILLERMRLLWKVLPFRYKSSLRNIFRYKVRLCLTVFSVIFTTALVFASFALPSAIGATNPAIMDLIHPVSSLIAVAAVALGVLVMYNIININIEERKREIATLMVLGYKNIEVTGYIFREVLFLTILGLLPGLPIGFLFMRFLFEEMAFGGIQYIGWYVWIVCAVVILASLAFTFLLLYKKILKTDMTSSLKSVD